MSASQRNQRVPPTGHRLFRKFLETNGIDPNQAAKALHVTHVAVISWRDGKSIPELPSRAAIAIYTGGAVPESSWLTKRERDHLAQMAGVQPFKAGGEAAAEPGPTFPVDESPANGGSNAA